MALPPGTRIGAYEIVGLIGAGGMGEVYRAKDTRLKRDVAIKVLPDAFANDVERLSRFQREAELLATLNHPNIGHVYGFEQINGTSAIILELIEGETLAERIKRGPIPIKTALNIAVQIAEALEAAHEHGVIHRDLKPANIKMTADEKVKVLDFGLAKAMEKTPATATLSHSPTLSIMATQPGMILGTAAYMSPEQAKGLPADQRSDVFAFGAVLYEMLTGRQAFGGDTASDVLASVIVRDVDLTALPPNLNPRLAQILGRCLEKIPRKRWQAIGDVRAEIEETAAAPLAARSPQPLPSRQSLWRRATPATLSAIAASAITATAFWHFRPMSAAPPLTRFALALPEGQRFTNLNRPVVAISPDGSQITYETAEGLNLRSMSSLEVRTIHRAGTRAERHGTPIFSPDGGSIVYWSDSDQTLKKVATSGGAPITLCPASNPAGMSWAGQEIFFGQPRGITRVSSNGGTPEVVVPAKDGEQVESPQLLPDGETMLFTVSTAANVVGRWEKAQIAIQSLRSGERRVLISGGSAARYVGTGHLVYALGGVLFAIGFDLDRKELVGGAVPMIEGVSRTGSGTTGTAHFSVSGTGTLVYVPGPVNTSERRLLAFVDRSGAVDELKVPSGPYETPRLSPDGKWIAVASDDGKDANVWIADPSGVTAVRRLTFDGRNKLPIWSPDGQYLAFQSNREGDLGIFRQRSDGTGPVERLTQPPPGTEHWPDSWSSDGVSLSFTAVEGTTSSDATAAVWILDLRTKTPSMFASVPSKFVSRSTFSPDGRWLAYSSDESGRSAIFLQPYPPTGNRYQIQSVGLQNANTPWWSQNGKELFFNEGPTRWFVVNIATMPNVSFSTPQEIPRAGGIGGLGSRLGGNFSPRGSDKGPDPQRTLTLVREGAGRAGARQEIEVVLNWLEELKQRVPIN